MQIFRLKPGNEVMMQELSQLYKSVFEMQPAESASLAFCTQILNNKNNIFVVAKVEETIIGGLSAYILPSVHGHSECYVFDLAVAEHLQRKGTGTLLMKHLSEICRKEGIAGVFVNAENEDEHAIQFYKKNWRTDE